MRRCLRCTHPACATDRYCLSCGQALPRIWGRGPWLLGGLLFLACVIGVKAEGPVGAATGATGHGQPPPKVASPPSSSPCRFVLGFQTLHDRLAARVGDCRDNEHYLPAGNIAVQHTTGGLLVWRKADNGVAFTDGAQTWVLGPHGLQQRPNSRRFGWEANPEHLPEIGVSAVGTTS